MKIAIHYKDVESHKPVEEEIDRATEKLSRLLKVYEPDLVQLHGTFSKQPRTEEYAFTLNLVLPTGTLHCTGTSKHLRASCKEAFSELESQIKKHQSRLRKDYEWKRKRPRARIPAEAVS